MCIGTKRLLFKVPRQIAGLTHYLQTMKDAILLRHAFVFARSCVCARAYYIPYIQHIFFWGLPLRKNVWNKWKNHFFKMKGDVGMADHEKWRKQEAALPIPTSLLLVIIYHASKNTDLGCVCDALLNIRYKGKDVGMGNAASCFLHFSIPTSPFIWKKWFLHLFHFFP